MIDSPAVGNLRRHLRGVTVARALAAAALLASFAATARALSPDDAHAAATRVDTGRILADLGALTAPALEGRRDGSTGASLTTAYLAKAFADAALGKMPGEKSYVVPAGADENVIGVLEGNDLRREAIVVSAHWDGVGTDDEGKLVPGADENATGLAALLDAARVLAHSHPRRTVVFAAFGGYWDKDDAQRFRGAKAFVKQVRGGKPAWKDLSPVCEIDLMSLGVPLMPFSPERFFVLGAETSPSLTQVVKELATATSDLRLARASVDLVEKFGPRDDYEAFREADVPFIYLSSGVSKNFHKASDTMDTVDPKRVAAATRLAIHAIAKVDALEAPPVYARESLRDGKSDASEVLGLLEAALDPKANLVMTESERRALTYKRERIQDMVDAGEVSDRDRTLLQDTLALLLVVLTK